MSQKQSENEEALKNVLEGYGGIVILIVSIAYFDMIASSYILDLITSPMTNELGYTMAYEIDRFTFRYYTAIKSIVYTSMCLIASRYFTMND